MSEILPQCYRNVQHAISSSYNFMVFFSFLFPSVPFILCYKKVVNSVVWLSSNSKRSCRRIWHSRNQVLLLTCVSGLRFVKSFYFIHNLGWHILMLAWFIKSFCDVELFRFLYSAYLKIEVVTCLYECVFEIDSFALFKS